MVHKRHVCDSSHFFRAAIGGGGWKESTEKLVCMPEIKTNLFAVYVCWLYTGDVDMSNPKTSSDTSIIVSDSASTGDIYQFSERWTTMIDAYALGDAIKTVISATRLSIT
jgi:hypothetical protein